MFLFFYGDEYMVLFSLGGAFLSLAGLVTAIKYNNQRSYWISITQFALFLLILIGG